MAIELSLPAPWTPGTTFSLGEELPDITWLVGANGTGKSRFLRALRDHPAVSSLRPRLVSTDRISSARESDSVKNVWGERLGNGIQKAHWDVFANSNVRDGSLVGTVVLLHRRPDLRMRIEASLSQLLNRHINLEIADGALLPRVRYGTSAEYGMFADECHGVLELLVLLANIYDEETGLLLIDEPELHLHPQYQAFIFSQLQGTGKRVVLATHSPNFMVIRTIDDLRGVVCFHHDFRLPSRYTGTPYIDREIAEILPRMNEQHRTFFFARSPVFVEGHFDALVIASIQRSLGLSAEAAGSCIVPAMGKADAGRYLMLCKALDKSSSFVLDLDALFDQRLHNGALQDADLSSRIAHTGHGELKEMISKLLRLLTDAVKCIENCDDEGHLPSLAELRGFFNANSGSDNLSKRRLAVLIMLAEKLDVVRQVVGQKATQARGLLLTILDQLSKSDIHVLPGGALENYLPSYTGNRFKIADDDKRPAAMAEQLWLATKRTKLEIADRYRSLVDIISKLPSSPAVDILPPLRRELANLLHRVIVAIRTGQLKNAAEAPIVLGENWHRVANFVRFTELNIRNSREFDGILSIDDRFGIGVHMCQFSDQTQTNDPDALCLKLVPRKEGVEQNPTLSDV